MRVVVGTFYPVNSIKPRLPEREPWFKAVKIHHVGLCSMLYSKCHNQLLTLNNSDTGSKHDRAFHCDVIHLGFVACMHYDNYMCDRTWENPPYAIFPKIKFVVWLISPTIDLTRVQVLHRSRASLLRYKALFAITPYPQQSRNYSLKALLQRISLTGSH